MAFLQSRSISLVDMYIDNSEPSENVGQIHFSLEYDFQNTTLILKIMQVSFKKLNLTIVAKTHKVLIISNPATKKKTRQPGNSFLGILQ